jgi:hypothetical protein
MKQVLLAFLSCVVVVALAGCQAATAPTGGPGFEQNPTDSGSRYSDFSMPGSRMGMQNVDLED